MYDQNYLIHYGVVGMRWGQRRITRAEAGLKRLDSGKHISIGLGKNRQGRYDTRDRKYFENIKAKTKKQMDSQKERQVNREEHFNKAKEVAKSIPIGKKIVGTLLTGPLGLSLYSSLRAAGSTKRDALLSTAVLSTMGLPMQALGLMSLSDTASTGKYKGKTVTDN